MNEFSYYKNLEIHKNYPAGKQFTTFKAGGNTAFICFPTDIEQIKAGFEYAKENNLNPYILGNGSNVLIADSGFKGLLISTLKFNKYIFNNNQIIAECGVSVNELCEASIKNNLSGLEFSYGLPASIGGAVFMNARSYGSEMSAIVEKVYALNENLEDIELSNKQIGYNYKKSIFMENTGWFIYKIVLNLHKGEKSKIEAESIKNFNDRKNKGQFDYPSAGCIFKNDYNVGIPSGKIIDELGLKGKNIGGAAVFDKHSNFIINKNNASAKEINELINAVGDEVYEQKKIKLETDIILLGFDDE